MRPSSKQVQIYLLGKFEVCREARVLKVQDWPRRKAAALFQRLAYERRLVKDQAIEQLWPDGNYSAGVNNLYRVLYTMRQALDQRLGEGASGEIFFFQDGILQLKDGVWVDAREFESMCQVIPGESTGQRFERFAEALKLYQGDFLPDQRYEEWTELPRRVLVRMQREVSLALAARRLEQGDLPAAIGLISPLLLRDPADEQAHCELMRLYALAGRRQEALRQYQLCLEALRSELGVDPDTETRALYLQIQQGAYPPQPEAPGKAAPVVNEHGHPQALLSRSPALQPRRPAFIGRQRELGVLEGHLDKALAGEGGVVFISGEAGQGKTCLMAEFAYQAHSLRPELVVAAGACQALGDYADPYLPFRDLLAMLSGDFQRPWLGGEIPTDHKERLQVIAPLTVRRLSSQATALVDILVARDLLPGLQAQPGQLTNQGQVFEQTRLLLHSLAKEQPLLLLLDDLQWADPASANLLFYLGRQLAGSPVLLLGAYRPSEVGAWGGREVSPARDSSHPLASVVLELVRYRGEAPIDLDASTTAEGRSFVDALLDSEPNQLDASFREAVFRRTKGQPLFTVELLRALQEQGDLVMDEQGIWKETPYLDWDILPARVEAVIARRIEQLPQELRRLLAVASVEGEHFTVEVLAQVQERGILPVLQYLSQELDHRYRLVREAGALNLAGQPLTRYQFRHNLFQAYLYQLLSIGERRYLHGEVAVSLERIAGGHLDDMAVTLAHHFRLAGQAERAAAYLCQAGDQARRRLALEEAVHFYRSALVYGQEQDAGARAEVLHKLGETLLATGKSQEAIKHLSEAEMSYAQTGNPIARGAVLRLIGRSYWEQADRARAMDHYHKALTLLEGGLGEAELARAISAIAQMEMLGDEYDQAIAWGERALALAKKHLVEDVVIHTLTTLGISRVVKGEIEQGLAMLEESKGRALELGFPHDACRAYTGIGDSLLRLERYAEARQVYEQMLAYSRKVQAAMFEGVALVHLGYLDWWAGRWRSAGSRRQEIVAWMEAIPGLSIARVWASTFLAYTYNDLGLAAKAQAVLGEYTMVARSANEPQTTLPHLRELARLSQDKQEKARLVGGILEMIDRGATPRYEMLPALALACTWLAQTSGGDVSALERLDRAAQQAQSRQSTASLFEVSGYAAGLRGDWEQAAFNYASAAGSWEALERPYDLLRTQVDLAQALQEAGDLPAAQRARQRALSLVERLAGELDEEEQRSAFMASSLVTRIRGS